MPGTFERDLVLYELKRLNQRVEAAAAELNTRINDMDDKSDEKHEAMCSQLSEIEKDLAHLKVRSSAFGVIGGAVATVIAYLVQSFGWPTGHA